MSSTPAPAILTEAVRLAAGDRVELYSIDLSPIGVSTLFHFTPHVKRTGTLSFAGIVYVGVDVKCEGFEISSSGSLPRPTITISNVDRVMGSAAVLNDDLIGARLTRKVTYRQFLTGEAQADANAAFIPEIYTFDQKVGHNKHEIQWSLASILDQEGVMLPRRVVVADICQYTYRRWTGSTWDYTNVECPYAGNKYYDLNGNEVANPAQDEPSRRLTTCCRKRFGDRANLPFGGFPGVGRLRV